MRAIQYGMFVVRCSKLAKLVMQILFVPYKFKDLVPDTSRGLLFLEMNISVYLFLSGVEKKKTLTPRLQQMECLSELQMSNSTIAATQLLTSTVQQHMHMKLNQIISVSVCSSIFHFPSV